MNLEEQLAIEVDPSRITSASALSEAEAVQVSSQEADEFDGLLKDQKIQDLELARRQRARYAGWTFWLVLGWVAFVALLLIFQEFCHGPHFHRLSEGVLITLISTTTVNLIGTFVIVLNYIFHVPGGTPTSP